MHITLLFSLGTLCVRSLNLLFFRGLRQESLDARPRAERLNHLLPFPTGQLKIKSSKMTITNRKRPHPSRLSAKSQKPQTKFAKIRDAGVSEMKKMPLRIALAAYTSKMKRIAPYSETEKAKKEKARSDSQAQLTSALSRLSELSGGEDLTSGQETTTLPLVESVMDNLADFLEVLKVSKFPDPDHVADLERIRDTQQQEILQLQRRQEMLQAEIDKSKDAFTLSADQTRKNDHLLAERNNLSTTMNTVHEELRFICADVDSNFFESHSDLSREEQFAAMTNIIAEERSHMISEKRNLELEKCNLETEKSNLEAEKQNLEVEKQRLEAENAALQKSTNDLEASCLSHQNDVKRLRKREGEHNALVRKRDEVIRLSKQELANTKAKFDRDQQELIAEHNKELQRRELEQVTRLALGKVVERVETNRNISNAQRELDFRGLQSTHEKLIQSERVMRDQLRKDLDHCNSELENARAELQQRLENEIFSRRRTLNAGEKKMQEQEQQLKISKTRNISLETALSVERSRREKAERDVLQRTASGDDAKKNFEAYVFEAAKIMDTVAKEKEELTTRFASEKETLTSGLSDAHAKFKQSKDDFERENRDLVAKLSTERTESEKSKKSMAKMEKKFKEELQLERQKFTNLTATSEKLKKDLEGQSQRHVSLQKKFKDATSKFGTQISSLEVEISKHQEELSEAERSRAAAVEDEICKYQKRLADEKLAHETELEGIKEEVHRIKDEFATERSASGETVKKFENELADLQQELCNKVEDHGKTTAQLTERHENELSKEKAQREMVMSNQKVKYDQDLSEERSQHARELSSTLQTHKQGLVEAQSQCEEQLKRQKENFEALILVEETKVEVLDKENTAKQAELAQVKLDHDRHVIHISEDFRQLNLRTADSVRQEMLDRNAAAIYDQAFILRQQYESSLLEQRRGLVHASERRVEALVVAWRSYCQECVAKQARKDEGTLQKELLKAKRYQARLMTEQKKQYRECVVALASTNRHVMKQSSLMRQLFSRCSAEMKEVVDLRQKIDGYRNLESELRSTIVQENATQRSLRQFITSMEAEQRFHLGHFDYQTLSDDLNTLAQESSDRSITLKAFIEDVPVSTVLLVDRARQGILVIYHGETSAYRFWYGERDALQFSTIGWTDWIRMGVEGRADTISLRLAESSESLGERLSRLWEANGSS